MRRSLSTVLAGVVITASGAASAAPAGAFIVTQWRAGQSDTALAQQMARDVVARQDHLQLGAVHEMLHPEGRPKAVAALRQAEQSYRRGFGAYTHESYAAALAAFVTAIDRYWVAAPELVEPAPIVRAMQYAGAAAIHLHRYRVGVRWLHRAAVMDPLAPMDIPGVDPGTVSLYDRVRERAMSAPPADLRIESEPSGATVFLDSRFVGVTPLVVPVPLAGTHVLRLERDGHLPWAGPIEALPGTVEIVRIELDETKHKARFDTVLASVAAVMGQPDSEGGDELKALGALLDLDEVMLGRADPVGDDKLLVTAFEYDIRGRDLLNRGNRLFDRRSASFAKDLTRFFEDLLGGRADVVVDASTLPPPPPDLAIADAAGPIDDDGASAIYARWWFWAGVGVLAAGGATAAVVAAQPAEEPERGRTGEIVFQF